MNSTPHLASTEPTILSAQDRLPGGATSDSPAPALAGRNPAVSLFNAAFFWAMDWYTHWKYAARKSALFADLPDTIVEIGPGAGANLRYLRRGTRVIAIEPNRHMHRPLRRAARKHRVMVDVQATFAERIDLPDASVDAVIASLVLCSVSDQASTLAEVKRILRPGGRLVCIEHVAAAKTSLVGRIQRAVLRPWRVVFEGCHTHRDTESALRAAGFARVAVEPFTLPTAFVPIRPQIAAVRTR